MTETSNINQDYAGIKYRINLSDKHAEKDVRHFRDAARDLFCHSCYSQPELQMILGDLTRIMNYLCSPIAQDSMMRALMHKGKVNRAGFALLPVQTAASVCDILFRLADSSRLTENEASILEKFYKLSEESRWALGRGIEH